jgi:peroxin-19
MARLTKEMETVMEQMSAAPGASTTNPDDMAKMAKQLEDFSLKMEEQGVKPEDILKAIMGEQAGAEVAEAAHQEHDRRESDSKGKAAKPAAGKSTFDEQIRKTMERMETSDTKATEATQQAAGSEEDMLAELLRAMETEGGGDGDGDLSKMFLGMMEQLTHKDMLYEPMKALDDKYLDWLAKNKSKLKPADAKRYGNQQVIVKEIVSKFEEKSYNDDDPKCRDYIWERMQKMQEEGAPPEELIDNPFPGMSGMPGLGALGGGDGEDPGCPTQ